MENAKISLLYQLEQRKVSKLERENRALRERINGLLKKQDDERIELLVADRTRRKLVQLRAITERTIKSLESGINEFRAFVTDINEAMDEEENKGAIQPLKLVDISDESDRILHNFAPKLKRIPESPVVLSAISTSKIGSNSQSESFHTGLEEEERANGMEEVVDETPHLDMMQTSGTGTEVENASNSKGNIEQRKSAIAPICSITLRQRSSALKFAPSEMKRTHIATPAFFAPALPSVSICEAEGTPSFATASSIPSTPLSIDNVSVTASGRLKRAAAKKVRSYQEPSLSKKMRR
ncbi:hypothetical protein niasHT_037049 [Heterodera trifolii]|uniref:Shugoshin C-terminal domain-containing protein n=1 Tax=Heterodera trifolii TaxID=157864 RepID=A0ABD2IRL8_9BILA